MNQLDALRAALDQHGRTHHLERGALVLDSGLALRLEELEDAVTAATARTGGDGAAGAALVAEELLRREHSLAHAVAPDLARVRLRVVDPQLLPPGGTLPGPAGLVVYPVADGPDAAVRLTGAQVLALAGGSDLGAALGWLGVQTMPATLAEPVTSEPFPVLGCAGALLLTGDIYTASRVLDLRRTLTELGLDADAGTLVAAPSSRQLLLVPPLPAPGQQVLAVVRDWLREAYAPARGKVCDQLLLWSGGRLERLDGGPGR